MRFLAAARPKRPPQATPALLAALTAYDWPGNVRELKAVIERAVLLAGGADIGPSHLAFAPRSQPIVEPAPPTAHGEELGFLSAEQRADRGRILDALDRSAGNQTRAAKLLEISRTTLVNKLALYRIPRPRPR
jgi:two-component system response regulator AtoC